MMRIFTVLFMSLAFLLTIGPCGQAQEEEFGLEPIQIVTKKSELLGGKIKDDRINELHSADAGDALKKEVEGISCIRRTGIALDPVLRGLSKDRLNILVDEGFLYGACANRMDPPTFHISPWDAESIEVKKGAFDVTYGPSVLAGVLNVKTKEPRYSEEMHVRTELKSGFDGVSSSFKEGMLFEAGKAPLGFLLAADHKNNQGYRDGRSKKLSTDFKQENLMAKLYYFMEEDKRIGLNYIGQRAKDVLYPGLSMDSPKDNMDMISLDGRLDYPLDMLKELEFKVYSSWIDHDMDSDSKFDYVTDAPTMRMSAPAKSRTYGAKLKGKLDVLDGLEAGIDYYNRLWDMTLKRWSLAGMPMADIRAIPDSTISDIGLFIQPKKEMGRFELALGSRVDFVNAKARAVGQAERGYFDSVYSAGTSSSLEKSEVNTGAFVKESYSLSDKVKLYAACGRAVRTADPRERFRVLLPISGNKRDIGNPNLKPEESLQYEIGLKADSGRLNYGLSLFRNEIENYIVQYDTGITSGSLGVTPDQPVMGYKNVEALLYGGEARAGFAVNNSLSLFGSASFTRGQNKSEDKPLAEIPPLQGRMGLRLDSPDKKSWLELSSRLCAAQHRYDAVVDPGKTEGFSVFDLRAGFRPKKDILLSFGVENLLDRYYSEHTSKAFAFNQDGHTTGERIPEPGRNVYLNVTLSF